MFCTKDEDVLDVIVIGAGISGLTAANELKTRTTLKILILEGKDRVGGRTETVTMRTGTATDQFDIGGQWVGVTQYHILDLLKELKLDIFPQYIDGLKVAQLGSADNIRKYTDAIPNTLNGLFQFSPFEIVSFALAVHELESMAAKLDPVAPFNTPEAADWDCMTVLEYVKNRSRSGAGRCQFVLDSLDVMCRTIYGVSSERLSALNFLVYGRSAGSILNLCEATGNGAQAYRIVGGSQQISRMLAENVGWDCIKLGRAVWKIRYGNDGVEVWTNGKDNEANNIVKGKRLILAVPPNQIGRILFEPPLPEDQNQLFSSFPSGNLFKFNVTYRTPFWRKKGLSGEIVATGVTEDPNIVHPVSITYDATTAHGNPAIVGFLNTEWCGSDGKVRREAVLADLARYLGPEALDYIDYVDKNWSEEPLNGGCPTCLFSPGTGSYYETGIRRVTGPIHWAGTETALQWMGYMSGAVEAGQRAAHQVMALFTPNALNENELRTVNAAQKIQNEKCLGKKRYYKKRKWCTWKTAAILCTVGILGTALMAKRLGFQSPVKIKLIYSV